MEMSGAVHHQAAAGFNYGAQPRVTLMSPDV